MPGVAPGGNKRSQANKSTSSASLPLPCPERLPAPEASFSFSASTACASLFCSASQLASIAADAADASAEEWVRPFLKGLIKPGVASCGSRGAHGSQMTLVGLWLAAHVSLPTTVSSADATVLTALPAACSVAILSAVPLSRAGDQTAAGMCPSLASPAGPSVHVSPAPYPAGCQVSSSLSTSPIRTSSPAEALSRNGTSEASSLKSPGESEAITWGGR
eukprot:scaffold179162_cov30-Tisochrysis_lutea.AAC.2